MLEDLEKISKLFIEAMQSIEKEQEEYWNSLSHDEQLKVFCCVVRRLAKAELEEGRSYRGVLYDTFKFGPESYAQAQVAGYLDLHNALHNAINR